MKLKVPAAVAPSPETAAPEKTVTEQLTLRKPIRIMVVDDNAVNLLVAKKMLKKMGASVTVAENGLSSTLFSWIFKCRFSTGIMQPCNCEV